MTYHVEVFNRDNDGWSTDSTYKSKYNADTRALELNHRGQFSRVVDSRGEIVVR